MADKRYFDLNIEQVLDNWDIYHAVREIIANALDETHLSKAPSIKIFKDEKGLWHIRDFGRGLNYEHFSQNENEEKHNSDGIIGKFGVGLKDALAVFYRNDVSVLAKSKFGIFTPEMYRKSGFNDMSTLHAVVTSPENPDFIGTEFILGINDTDLEKAKSLFLHFNSDFAIEKTNYGEIYHKNSSSSSIYVNGIKVAEEENYMFDYNITRLSAPMKKALNRERTNVGRTAYADTVKKLLLKSQSVTVIEKLVLELKSLERGDGADEINYLDVQIHAMQTYNIQKPVVFISQLEAYELTNDDKEKISDSGRELVIVPQNAFDKIKNMKDINGEQIGTFDVILQEYNESFEYDWVLPNKLNASQRVVWEKLPLVMEWLKDEKWINKVKISRTINETISGDTAGVFDPALNLIIIKDTTLDNEQYFYDVLIHEYIHATTRFPDNDRRFESELGKIIGRMGMELFNEEKKIKSNDVEASVNKKSNFLKRLFSK